MTAEASTPLRSGRGHTISPRKGAKKPAKSLSAEHKLALSAGRDESRAVRRYLEALHTNRAGGNETRPESLARRIDAIDAQLASAPPVVKVRLIQERMDLYAQLKASGGKGRLDELERGFISAAGAYSARKGISYAAWREVGVDHEVLKRAGIPRTA